MFDLIILVLKVLGFSFLYASLLMFLILLFARRSKRRWVQYIKGYRLASWLFLFLWINVALFFYAFSYWRDVGLGEDPSLPIGYGQRIYSPDFQWTVYFPDLEKTVLNKDELKIDSFIVKDAMLCATVSHFYSDSPGYDFIVSDLKKRETHTFMTEADYNAFAIANKLPFRQSFLDFDTHCRMYINRSKWKRWLLP